MFFLVTLCLVTNSIQLCNTHSYEEPVQYECGPHGKFEYCINSLVGCVIGCHCHPGFYFDTDTKICEPNSKLTENVMRRSLSKPTRAYIVNTPSLFDDSPTPNPVDNINSLYDETIKDNDNLGDWLYSQFFKTIESQVINSTNEEKPTRRAGGQKKHGIGRRDGQKHFGKMKKKEHKLWKSKVKKKKNKDHSLRRKLLRITEDDSLFDTEESDSDDQSSDSDGSDSDNSSDQTESKEEKHPKKEKDSTDDTQHGHKKVIIYNKRPKPPLPSFIFMPSVDTPFYPPIGLPPPPMVPMYPLVPVPPMISFGPGNTDHSNASSTTIASPSEGVTNAESETEITTPPADAEESKANTRTRIYKNKRPLSLGMPSAQTFMLHATKIQPRKSLPAKQDERHKLMQKIRDKLKKQAPPQIEQNAIEYPESGDLMEDIPGQEDSSVYIPFKKTKHKHKQIEADKSLTDVNFKYLSELIHKLNNTKNKTPSFNMHDDIEQFHKIQNARRAFNQVKENFDCQDEVTLPTTSDHQNVEDAYFTNLGRQIACMVRSVDTKLDKVDSGPKELFKDMHSVIDPYSPRSFWERTIRSPLKKFPKELGRFEKQRHSAEIALLNLENKISYIASTTPPLKLQDLENILNTMNTYRGDEKSSDRSNDSFNVDLLLNKPSQSEIYHGKFINLPEKLTYVAKTTSNQYSDDGNRDLPMFDEWAFYYEHNKKPSQPPMLNKTIDNISNGNPNTIKPFPNYKSINKQLEYLKFIKQLPYLEQWGEQNLKIQPELDSKPSEPQVKYPKTYTKVTVNYPEMPAQFSVLLAKYPELHPEIFSEDSPKPMGYSEIHENNPNVPVKQPNILKKAPYSHIMKLQLNKKYPNTHAKGLERLVKYPKNHANDPDLFDKHLDISANDPEPLNNYPYVYTKSQDLLDKYGNIPARFPKNYPQLLPKFHNISAKYPILYEQYLNVPDGNPNVPEKYPNMPEKYPDIPEKNQHVSEKYSYVPEKDLYVPDKYPDVPEKYPDIPEKNHFVSEKYSYVPEKDLYVPDKYPNVPEKDPNIPLKYLHGPEKYSKFLVNYPNVPEKYPYIPDKRSDVPEKYSHVPERYPYIPENYSQIAAKQSEHSIKSSEQYIKYSLEPGKYNKLSKIYYNANPLIAKYKSVKFYPKSENNHYHYRFERFPLTEPENHDFAKPFQNYDQNPSYFHHEHHFDYYN